MRAAGAVVIGRTRTHEFAWGLTTWHPDLGGTHNPAALDRVAGGSSGGSAAAVAVGAVPLALGTDTGCSLRLPGAWCGVVGHKPTHGSVPLSGVQAASDRRLVAAAKANSLPKRDLVITLSLLCILAIVLTRLVRRLVVVHCLDNP